MPPLPWPMAACSEGRKLTVSSPAPRIQIRGEKRGERIDVAGGPALLNGLQNLPDGFAVVVGGAAGRARLLDRFEDLPIGARPGVECALVVILTRKELVGVMSPRTEPLLLSIGASLMFKAS